MYQTRKRNWTVCRSDSPSCSPRYATLSRVVPTGATGYSQRKATFDNNFLTGVVYALCALR